MQVDDAPHKSHNNFLQACAESAAPSPLLSELSVELKAERLCVLVQQVTVRITMLDLGK